jgi:CBS-domain-containing membrane protein
MRNNPDAAPGRLSLIRVYRHQGVSHVGAIERMSEREVRRAPVVDDAGKLIGLVSFDDLLPHLTHNLSYLAELIGSQSHQELPRA